LQEARRPRRPLTSGAVRWVTSGVGTTGHRVLEQVRACPSTSLTTAIKFIAGSQTSLPQFKSVTGNITGNLFQFIRLDATTRQTLGHYWSPL